MGRGQKVFMNKGDGEHGYSKNSTGQRRTSDELLFRILSKDLQQVSLPTSEKPIVVADLGSSSGPNSIVNVAHIVKMLQSRCSEYEKTPREFQVYFNDLPWNDFNALFKLLCKNEAYRSNFYAAGVPGSFFERLFPRTSVHVFISVLAVHYLSKIPDSVTDENSLAFNKGKLWLEGSTDATTQAYKEQFLLDLKSFLQARYEELVPGGLLCFIVKTRRVQKANVLPSTEDSLDAVQICIRETADEIFLKGILTEQQLDALNVPSYFPTFEEEQLEIVKHFSGTFEMLTAEEIGFSFLLPRDPSISSANEVSDTESAVRAATSFARGILGGFFEQVMADEEQELYWQHFARNAVKYASNFRQDAYFGCISMLKK